MNGFIIIPVKNEEESISLVLRDLLSVKILPSTSILVVDNGSTDSTRKIVKDFTITYLYEEKKGYGNACLKGLEYIENVIQKPDWVAFMDGDYSDSVEDLLKLIKIIESGDAEFISGDRTFIEGQEVTLEFAQRFGNSLICKLIKLFLNREFSDLGPLRVIKYSKLLEMNMKDTTWGWNIEMNLKAILFGLQIMEIPVLYKKRYSGTSKISGNWKMILPVGCKILYTFLKILILHFKNARRK